MRRVCGYSLVGVGAFFTLGILLNLGGGHAALALLFAFALVGAGPIAAGAYLLRGDKKLLDARARSAWDSELMRLAEKRGGSLTVGEVVAHADLDAARAEEYLDDFCRRGLAEYRVSEDGQVIYAFTPSPSLEQKRLAKGVLDD